eukprot:Skav215984  [mRNA]  locus=scaffold4378:65161:68471:+ [translate_table: standard]
MPSPEALEDETKANSIMVKRVAEYLPEKQVEKTMNPKAPETFVWLLYSLFTGKYLALSDKLITSDRQVTGAKDNLINECTNMGLISALLLTIVLPMSYESVTDWLEEDYAGSGFLFGDSYIGSLLTEDQIQNGLVFLNDFSLIFYVMGVLGFLESTCGTVVQLLCVAEVATDSGRQDFMRRVGKATHAPFMLFLVGGAFVFPAMVRYAVSCKTLAGRLIVLILVIVVMFFFFVAMNYFYVAGCTRVHNRINEFQGLNLSNAEAQQDVEAWFEKNQHGAHVEDCLLDLCGIIEDKKANSELIIPLDTVSKQRVALHYHKLCSESVGITLPATELYKLSRQLPE